MAEDYEIAMYNEDFQALGEFSVDLLKDICRWLNYTEEMGNLDKVQDIKTTIKERTFIDAIYENKVSTLAETYLLNGVYSPKLVLTIILSDEDEYDAFISCENQEDLESKMKQLYDFIEIEYKKSDDKKLFLNKIKNNYNRIRISKEYISKPIPNTYSWTKELCKKLKHM
jgi:C-terminal processing protease CtpA/Prc